MKKLLLNIIKKGFLITLILFFSFSFFVKESKAQFPCAPGLIFYNNACISKHLYDLIILRGGGLNSYNDVPYQPLAPVPGFDGSFDFTKDCALGRYLDIMINLILGLIAVMAMVKIVMGGLEYMTSELVSSKENGKETIMNAVLGLVIALTAYLILNTLNPNLLNLCLDNIPRTQIVIDDDVPQKLVNGKYGDYTAGSPTNHNWASQAGTSTPTPLPLGVKVNKGECQYVGQPNCTSLLGLNPRIINSLHLSCLSCQLIITGGTENWAHSASGTHRPGSATIDLSPTKSLNKYLTGQEVLPKKEIKLEKGGIKYHYHKNHEGEGYHWHVS